MKLEEIAGEGPEQWFETLGRGLDLPPSRYDDAERSYKSVARWLERQESEFHGEKIEVYTQGSFRLGTAIQPFGEDDDYDLDIVCEFDFGKTDQTQEELARKLGRELKAYAERYGMDEPEGWDRCWTLNYAESAQFHMDILPCVPDATQQHQVLLRESVQSQRAMAALRYVGSAVAITDKKHGNYARRSEEWPTSNPNGYANWFQDRMTVTLGLMRKALALESHVDVAEIPDYQVRTPLQLAVQILKRHRDIYFSVRDPDVRPSSVVLTTLAAHAYGEQRTVLTALEAIVDGLEQPIEIDVRKGHFLPNPTDPRENFLDSWRGNPAKVEAFYEWATAVRQDVGRARVGGNLDTFKHEMGERLGKSLVESAFARTLPDVQLPTIPLPAWKSRKLRTAKHRAAPIWPSSRTSIWRVTLEATMLRNGFRPESIPSNEPDLPLKADLTFRANTNVPPPYDVYWQVVNTGVAATDANQLRGQIQHLSHGRPVHTETTAYPGTHSIECFVVKDGYIAARSDIFVVNIGRSPLYGRKRRGD